MKRRRGTRRARFLLVAGCVAGLVGCAKKLPPPGGRPDQEPPLLGAARPESGAVRVPRAGALELEFTEPMNERQTSGAVLIAPYARASKFEWKGKIFRYVLADSLRADQTYLLYVGAGARDVRGNGMPAARTVLFTTGDSLPRGVIEGRVEGRGHSAAGVFVWGYRADLGHAPDSTARDFDGLAVAEASGRFALRGLPIPSAWRLYAFHDVNGTQTFEPGTDHLTAQDTLFMLTPESPRADSARVVSLDPIAPGLVQGRIVDPDSLARRPLRLVVEQVVATEGAAKRWENPVVSGPFQISLDPGRYRIWLYRDDNRNARPDPGEARSEPIEFEIAPAEEWSDLEVVAPRGSGGETGGP